MGFIHAYNAGFGFVQDEKNNWDFSWSHKFDRSPREILESQAYHRYEVLARFSRILTKYVTLNLSGTRRHDEYTKAHPLFPDRQRSDIGLLGSLGFSFKVTPKVLFDISGSYIDNKSNIPQNTYLVKQLNMTLTVLFGG